MGFAILAGLFDERFVVRDKNQFIKNLPYPPLFRGRIIEFVNYRQKKMGEAVKPLPFSSTFLFR